MGLPLRLQRTRLVDRTARERLRLAERLRGGNESLALLGRIAIRLRQRGFQGLEGCRETRAHGLVALLGIARHRVLHRP